MSTGLLLFRAVIHRPLATCSPDPLPRGSAAAGTMQPGTPLGFIVPLWSELSHKSHPELRW